MIGRLCKGKCGVALDNDIMRSSRVAPLRNRACSYFASYQSLIGDREMSNGNKLDWLDRRCFYVLDYLEITKHTFIQDINPLNMVVIPLWIWRELYRALRGKPTFQERVNNG
jgi:hypothetical protein